VRRPPRSLLAALASASALSACAVENPELVRDTTGAEIGWSCELGRCVTVQETFSPIVPTDCGERTEHLVGAGGLAILCAVSQGARGEDVVHERTCRPLACGDELDCPQWQERGYACLEGICQSTDDAAFDWLDMVALCLFDLSRHESCAAAEADAEVARRLALADAACEGGRCGPAPAGCLAP
jgi:hypothetical protein